MASLGWSSQRKCKKDAEMEANLVPACGDLSPTPPAQYTHGSLAKFLAGPHVSLQVNTPSKEKHNVSTVTGEVLPISVWICSFSRIISSLTGYRFGPDALVAFGCWLYRGCGSAGLGFSPVHYTRARVGFWTSLPPKHPYTLGLSYDLY